MTFYPERARAEQARRGGPRREQSRGDADLRRQGPRYSVPAAFRPAGPQFPAGARRGPAAGSLAWAVRVRRPGSTGCAWRQGRAKYWGWEQPSQTATRIQAISAQTRNTRLMTSSETPASSLYTAQLPLTPRFPAGAGDIAAPARAAGSLVTQSPW